MDEKGKWPAYRWYPKDFLSDENVRMMDFEQQGIFRFLLDYQWLEGSIPADQDDLIALLWQNHSSANGKIEEHFAKVWKRVGRCFVPLEGSDGRLVNLRLERERQARAEFAAERRAAGSKGAAKRWSSQSIAHGKGEAEPKPSDSKSNGKPKAQAKQDHSSANGSVIEEPMANDGYPVSNNTEAIASDADASEAGLKPFDEVRYVLEQVHEALGWDPPLDKDVRRRLRPTDALRQLVEVAGLERAIELFVWAARNWQGSVSWEAVFDKRNQIADKMASAPKRPSERAPLLSESELEDRI
jgi:uncharacterized protein YdaU (DUF1376 family)